MSKAQLLQVQFKEDQGLIFQWNYANFTTQAIYFRHIIILWADSNDWANAYLKKYIKKIKPGDFYYILYVNEMNKLKNIGWKEKLVSNQTNSSKPIIKENIAEENKELLMNTLQNFYQEFSEPIVTCILMKNIKDKEWFESRIIRERYNDRYDFMTAFFLPIEKSTLSFGQKVSTFSTQEQEVEGQIDYFLSNVYQAGVLWAKLSIECLNGSITSMIDSNWRTTAFNQIERVYRGPSMKYDKDYLCLYNRMLSEGQYDLVLRLTFMTLQKRKFVSEKRISINSNGDFYQKTFNMSPWTKNYHATKSIWLTENPFSTFTVVKFE